MSPTISTRSARAVVEAIENKVGTHDKALRVAIEQLRAQLGRKSPKPFSSGPTRKATKAKKKATKSQRAKDLRTALIERSDASCELCGAATCASPRRFDVHHALGRKGLEDGVHNCLFLCEFCHERVTNPDQGPTGAYASQAVVFGRLGHWETAAELLKKAEFARSKSDALESLRRSSMTEEAIASAGLAGAKT